MRPEPAARWEPAGRPELVARRRAEAREVRGRAVPPPAAAAEDATATSALRTDAAHPRRYCCWPASLSCSAAVRGDDRLVHHQTTVMPALMKFTACLGVTMSTLVAIDRIRQPAIVPGVLRAEVFEREVHRSRGLVETDGLAQVLLDERRVRRRPRGAHGADVVAVLVELPDALPRPRSSASRRRSRRRPGRMRRVNCGARPRCRRRSRSRRDR